MSIEFICTIVYLSYLSALFSISIYYYLFISMHFIYINVFINISGIFHLSTYFVSPQQTRSHFVCNISGFCRCQLAGGMYYIDDRMKHSCGNLQWPCDYYYVQSVYITVTGFHYAPLIQRPLVPPSAHCSAHLNTPLIECGNPFFILNLLGMLYISYYLTTYPYRAKFVFMLAQCLLPESLL